jgi:hypothetical protein
VTSSTPSHSPGSGCSSGTRAARARPSSCGKASTSRWTTATGRSSALAAALQARASTRCLASSPSRDGRHHRRVRPRHEAAERCGFDLLELHCAHGYLLSSFISPLTNHRSDEYGGSLADRLRYPLDVFRAMRDAWPPAKPMSVRISATDWHEHGVTGEDSVLIAEAFAAAGRRPRRRLDRAGRPERAAGLRAVLPDARTPTRSATGWASPRWQSASSPPTTTSTRSCWPGGPTSARSGRAHLYDPNWTLHAAAEQGYAGPGVVWPDPWKAGSRKPQGGRLDGSAAAAEAPARGRAGDPARPLAPVVRAVAAGPTRAACRRSGQRGRSRWSARATGQVPSADCRWSSCSATGTRARSTRSARWSHRRRAGLLRQRAGLPRSGRPRDAARGGRASACGDRRLRGCRRTGRDRLLQRLSPRPAPPAPGCSTRSSARQRSEGCASSVRTASAP